MIGYEIEVDLAVTNQEGGRIKGDAPLASSNSAATPSFNLVTDSRTLLGGGKYSNVEFVSDPISVIGRRRDTGPVRVLAQLDEIERIRTVLYGAGAARLEGLDPTLIAWGAGTTAVLAPHLGYRERHTLFVQYSCGVELAGMPHFFDRVRHAAPVPAPSPRIAHLPALRARFSLRQARLFADSEIRIFLTTPDAPAPDTPETLGLYGYLQLAYLQIVALADHLDYDNKKINIKNLAAILCRSAFSYVFPMLSDQAQAYLIGRCAGNAPIITNLAHFQEAAEPGGNPHTFHETGIREVKKLTPITLGEFALSAFKGTPYVDPQRVFGGMREILPHNEEGIRVVPFEIRTIGPRRKNWTQVRSELTDLCKWAEEAYRIVV